MVEKKIKAEAVTKEAKPVKKAGKKVAVQTGKLVVMQVGSPIGRHKSQRATLIGLGLNKIRRVSEVPDTDATRGMIESVKHLVKLVD